MLLDEFAQYNDDMSVAGSEVIQQRITLITRLSKMLLVQEQIKRSMAQLKGQLGASVMTGASLSESHRLMRLTAPANGTKTPTLSVGGENPSTKLQ